MKQIDFAIVKLLCNIDLLVLNECCKIFLKGFRSFFLNESIHLVFFSLVNH